jgi:hypothetical protein
MFWIEDIVWDSQGTSVSAAGGRTFGQSRAASRQVDIRRRGFCDDQSATSSKALLASKGTLCFNESCNSLKSQKMRAPSERTKRLTY